MTCTSTELDSTREREDLEQGLCRCVYCTPSTHEQQLSAAQTVSFVVTCVRPCPCARYLRVLAVACECPRPGRLQLPTNTNSQSSPSRARRSTHQVITQIGVDNALWTAIISAETLRYT
jgi:hypothetical protein